MILQQFKTDNILLDIILEPFLEMIKVYINKIDDVFKSSNDLNFISSKHTIMGLLS